MKAVFQKIYGRSDVLEYGDLPKPAISRRQVLVELRASSVNPRDWLIRSGKYQVQWLVPAFPLVLGSDVSGVVVEVGADVRRFKPGDKVLALKNPAAGLGAHAEFTAVDEDALALLPDTLGFEEAGGMPLCALTAWQALVDIAGLQRGMQLLVIGASGGVGTFAVQIAVALGAVVTGVCSEANQALVSRLGSHHTIDYKTQDFKAIPDRYDIVFDTIGRESLKRCAAILKPGGIYVSTIPSPKNIIASLTSKARQAVLKSSRRCGVVMVKSDGVALKKIADLSQSHALTTVIESIFPLQEAKKAHDLSRSFRAKGKVILKIKA